MKISQILLISLIIVLSIEGASKKFDLGPGQDFLIEDRNITLLAINDNEKSAIFCVNGVKNIVDEDDFNIINDVWIEIIRIENGIVSLQADYTCKDCVCGENCDNSICFVEEPEEIQEQPEETEEENFEDEVIPINTEELENVYVEPIGIGRGGIIFASLIVIILILALIVLWRKN